MSDVTRLLDAVERGEPQAAEELLPLVYEELRRLARQKMALEKPGQTLQPTALVHEVWLRISAQDHKHYPNSEQFFLAASEMMRRVLVDRARKRRAFKHGGHLERIPLEAADPQLQGDDLLLHVHQALAELESRSPDAAEVVKLRFFTGLGCEETAALLGTSERTVRRHWTYAKAWLCQELA